MSLSGCQGEQLTWSTSSRVPSFFATTASAAPAQKGQVWRSWKRLSLHTKNFSPTTLSKATLEIGGVLAVSAVDLEVKITSVSVMHIPPLLPAQCDITCAMCKASFSGFEDYKEHFSMYFCLEKLECHLCQERFCRIVDFFRHLLVVHDRIVWVLRMGL
jgi:hypothetical protein